MQFSIRAELYDETEYLVATQYVELDKKGNPPAFIEFEECRYCLRHFWGERAKYQIGADDDVPF